MFRPIIPWVEKDGKARGSFLQYNLRKIIIKSLLYNQSQQFSDFYKMCWSLNLHNFPAHSSQAVLRRGCGLTNSARSIFRMFKMSRHSMKRWVSKGRLPGVRKASF